VSAAATRAAVVLAFRKAGSIMAGMKAWVFTGLLFAVLAAAVAPRAAGAGAPGAGSVYIIPVEEAIDSALLYVMRRGLREAEAQGAEAIVFVMDTPGGRLDAAEEILKLLRGVHVPTYTFVNPNAISAGAIIALATDHIYMAPGSKIGDAMPIMLSLFGNVEQLPEAVQEKMTSYVAAMIRAAAQQKGHDPRLAEAMVRRDAEYRVGDDVISAKGRLLTLTNQDAERKVGPDKRPLLSEGTVKDIDELLARIGKADRKRVELTVTGAEKVARVIESLSIILLAAGLLGLYIEFKTPGFGLPGILGILLLAIWFWGYHIAGLAGMEEVVLFIVGVILLAIELAVLPGFGVTGVLGIGLIVLSILLAMVGHYPGEPWYPTFPQIEAPLRQLALALVLSLAGLMIVGRFLPRTALFGRLVLAASTHRNAGFQASADTRALVGRRGVAETQLRPAGAARIGDARLQVVTRGDFIEAGEQIVVAEAHGNRIIVQKSTKT
jgi:membrane-bound serine protease (ClpP class)